jgi:hypothetical protein
VRGRANLVPLAIHPALLAHPKPIPPAGLCYPVVPLLCTGLICFMEDETEALELTSSPRATEQERCGFWT